MPEQQSLLKIVRTATLPPQTRFEASECELPHLPPPYSSMLDDAARDVATHLRKEKLRQAALWPVRLRAGQSELPMGGLGRHAVPVELPEMRGGRILSQHI